MTILLFVLAGLTLLALWRLSRPSLDSLIKRAKFDHVYPSISAENGWSNRESATSVRPKGYLLMRIDRSANRSDVDRRLELEQLKYSLRTVRHATLRDLVIYAGSKRGWNGQDTVFALDSEFVSGLERYVPCIWVDAAGSDRVLVAELNTGRFGDGECVLLVVE